MGKNLSELLQEAKDENHSQIEIMDRKITLNLLRFKKYLIECGKAPGTINQQYSAVVSFYKSFQITLPTIRMDRGDIGLEKNMGKRMDRKDIQRMASMASPRERALIYLMALSGMGQQEARDLKINKFLEVASQAINVDLKSVSDLFLHEEQVLQEVLTLDIRRKKVNYKHITFIPPETSREIINYLKERFYGRNEYIRIKNKTDYIFVNVWGEKLGRGSIVTNFRNAGFAAGFEKEFGSYSFWRSHSLRKYFISKIINKSGDKTIADYMAGHAINAQDRTYWEANPNDLKKLYLQVLPHLSIDQIKMRYIDSDELKELKADAERNSEIVELLEKNQRKLESLLNDAEFLEKHLEDLKKEKST